MNGQMVMSGDSERLCSIQQFAVRPQPHDAAALASLAPESERATACLGPRSSLYLRNADT